MKTVILALNVLFLGELFAKEASRKNDFAAKKFKKPLREISVIVTEDGFFPNKIMGYMGEQIRFYITSSTNKKECLILQKHDVFLSAQKGTVNETLVDLDRPGRFRFYCPSSKHVGYLTVIEKAVAEETSGSRSIASEPSEKSKPRYWTPRDYDE